MRTTCIILALTLATAGAAEYIGRVTASGKPMKGVPVSDGQNVVLTNAAGTYALPGHAEARFVFLTVPAGWRPEKRHYLRIEKGRTSYDFNLLPWKRSAGKTISFIQWADTETAGGGEVWSRNATAYAEETGAAFIIHVGDICYRNGLKYHSENLCSEKLGMPVMYCVGNHDLLKDTSYGEEYFEELFGPTYYSFNAGPAHFIVTPMLYGDAKPSYTEAKIATWLKNDLAHVPAGSPLFMFTHTIPKISKEMFNYGGIDLRAHGLVAWVYGHYHINYTMNLGGVWAVCAAPLNKGGINHAAACYPVFTVSKKGVEKIERRHCFIDHHVAIVSPKAESAATGPLMVSAYDSGSRVRRVSAVLDTASGRKTTILEAVPGNDWTWRSRGNIPSGLVRIRVTARFDDGKTATAELTPKIVAAPALPDFAGAKWPAPYGDAELHATAGTKTSRELSLTELWTASLPGQCWMASPLIANGKIFCATTDDCSLKNCGITALNLRDGKQLWFAATPNSIANGPQYWNGKIIVTDVEGNVVAFSEDGQLAWQNRSAYPDREAFVSGPVLKDGVYYSPNPVKVMAFDAANGRKLWKDDTNSASLVTTSTPASVIGNLVLFSSQWQALYAMDAKSGKGVWKATGPSLRFRGAGVTQAPDGNLATISSRSFELISPKDGSIIREVNTGANLAVTGPPVFLGNKVFFSTVNSGLMALQTDDWTKAWTVKTGRGLVSSSPYSSNSTELQAGPVLVNGLLLVGGADGVLYLVRPDDGVVVQKVPLGLPVFAPVAVIPATETAPGMAIVNDFSGTVHCFAIK